MGSEEEEVKLARHLNPGEESRSGSPTDQKHQYSYVKSRLQRSRSEAAQDIKAWATDGMKGHVLLVRNSKMLVANIIAERALDTQLWDLARERNECLRARDRDRQLFLKHLSLKGDRFRDIVVKIESRKKVRPSTVQLPVYQRRGLLSRAHEYPLVRRVSSRRTSGVDDAMEQTLMVHPLPFLSETTEDKAEKQAGNDETSPKFEVEPCFHKEESQPITSRRNIRSTSAIPATRGRYESCFPVRVRNTDAVNAEFLRSSNLLQDASSRPEQENGLDLCGESEPEVRSKSCCVFSEYPRRPVTAPECIHVSKLIDDIDSLHVPSMNQRKAKARTHVMLNDYFEARSRKDNMTN